jgi:phospholipid/cholesterol/gamma-HCH transport system substrate-binding protein
MESRSHALVAGLFLVLFVSGALGTLWWFAGPHDEMREIVLVSQQTVSGLNPQAAVRYRGVRIGKVTRIRFDPDNPRNILVDASVTRDAPITDTTVAHLAHQGLTGQAFVLLEDGAKANPRQEEDGVLRMPLQPSLVSQGVDVAMELLRQVKETTTRLNALLADDNRERIGRTLDNVERLTDRAVVATEGLSVSLERLQKLVSEDNVARVDRVLKNVAEASGQAGGLVQESRQLAGSLRQVASRLEQTLAEVDTQALSATPGRVNALTEQVGQTVENLDRLLRQLEESPQSLLFGRSPREPGPGEAGFAKGAAQ